MSVVKFSAGASAAKMVSYLAHGRGGSEGDEPRYAAWSNNLGIEKTGKLAAAWEMTRQVHSNEGGREYYHASYNLDPKDSRASQISDHELVTIGEELAGRMAPGHDYACFVHRDREHPHVHVVWNTVHAETGRKYQQGPADLERAFEIKNEIDRSHGLRVTERAPQRDRIPDQAQRMYARDSQAYLWTEDLKAAGPPHGERRPGRAARGLRGGATAGVGLRDCHRITIQFEAMLGEAGGSNSIRRERPPYGDAGFPVRRRLLFFLAGTHSGRGRCAP